MRTISRVLSNLLLALFIAAGVVGTSVATDQRYPIFVDCPDDMVSGNHCDTIAVQVRAELPNQNHPNNANIRYHLIAGPGEIDERTGLWSWHPDATGYGWRPMVVIAASIGNSSEHTTPPGKHCHFTVEVIDEPTQVLLNGQPHNSTFFVTAPGIHRFSIEVIDPDICDTGSVRITGVFPRPEGSIFIDNDELVFEADALDGNKKFQVALTAGLGGRVRSDRFYFDTRENPPVPVFQHCPDDMILTQCDQVRYEVLASDPDSVGGGGITYELVSGPGRIEKSHWFYEPGQDDVNQTYEVEIAAHYGPVVTTGDENCRFSVTIVEQPAGIHPMDFTCSESVSIPSEISTKLRMRAFDNDCGGMYLQLTDVSPPFFGSINVLAFSLYPSTNGVTHILTVMPDSLDADQTFHVVIEGNGEYGGHYTCELDFVVEEPQPYRIAIQTLVDVPQGGHIFVDVVLEEASIPFGWFDFKVGYDASAIAAVRAIPGPFFEQCDWGRFEYRFGSIGPGQSDPLSGLLRITGRAYYSPTDPSPTCFLPDSLPATLFTIDFTVTNDRTFECDSIPIQFYWERCKDNMITARSGRDLFISNDVFDAEDNLLPLVDSLPSISGVSENCFDERYHDRLHRLIDFQHGGIHIVCADSFDFPVGDINLNRVPYEIADLMIFTDYFLYGETVLTLDPRAQRQTSNINLDDRYLTIEDFHWFVQVHRGEVDPSDPYDTSSPNPAFFRQEPDGVVSVATPDTLGAAWFVFDNRVAPVLMSTTMGMIYYQIPYGGTRVLIYSLNGNHFTAGPLLSNVDAPLLEVQTCTYNGAKVEAIIDQSLGVNDDDDAKRPDRFALMQNYPNPFNNSTVIRFDLPRASEVQLTVYNIIGQVVVQRTRYYEAGYHEFVWDGRSKSGDEMAGGVYFYQLQAGSFTSTKKMLLLK